MILTATAWLRLGENASLQMKQNKLDGTQLELNHGSALIEIAKKIEVNPISVYLSNGVIEIKKAGLYRIDSSPSKLRVYGGAARVIIGDKKTNVSRNMMVRLDGNLARSALDRYDVDELHRWAAQRSFLLFAAALKDIIEKYGFISTRFISVTWKVDYDYPIKEMKNIDYRMHTTDFIRNSGSNPNWQKEAIEELLKHPPQLQTMGN
jgi:hypothetical protein